MNEDVRWFRDHSPESVDLVLRTAEVFVALGDREVVEQCIRRAERLAANRCDGDALRRVQAFADRVTPRPSGGVHRAGRP